MCRTVESVCILYPLLISVGIEAAQVVINGFGSGDSASTILGTDIQANCRSRGMQRSYHGPKSEQ